MKILICKFCCSRVVQPGVQGAFVLSECPLLVAAESARTRVYSHKEGALFSFIIIIIIMNVDNNYDRGEANENC